MHETGLQSRFSCLAQNVFQSNCKLTTLLVIYLYHKQDWFFFSFLLVMYRMFSLWAPGKQSILRQIRFRGSVNLLYRMEAQYLRVVLLSIKQKNDYCVGRESNPGQLLGRQLCSPLYHRRLDVKMTLKNDIDFLVKSGKSKCSHGKSAVLWNLPLIRVPPWSDQRPGPFVVRLLSFVINFLFSPPFTPRPLEVTW